MPTDWEVLRMSQAIHWTTAEIVAAGIYLSAAIYLCVRAYRRLTRPHVGA